MNDTNLTRQNRKTIVRCVQITKYFGGVRALDNVSLELVAGEIVGLVGDNGAGKSTLVKIFSGIHQPDQGGIWIDDAEVSQLTPKRAREFGIETVYQQLFLCDNLGAAANVMLGQEPVRSRIGPLKFLDNARSIAEASKHISGLGVTLPDLTSPVRRLSGGQRQSIAIARATVNAHRLIQFDEPTAALGIRQTQATLQLLRRVASQGVAVIIISHNLDDVFAVSDRIVSLRLGRITLNEPVSATSREQVVASMTGISFRQDPS